MCNVSVAATESSATSSSTRRKQLPRPESGRQRNGWPDAGTASVPGCGRALAAPSAQRIEQRSGPLAPTAPLHRRQNSQNPGQFDDCPGHADYSGWPHWSGGRTGHRPPKPERASHPHTASSHHPPGCPEGFRSESGAAPRKKPGRTWCHQSRANFLDRPCLSLSSRWRSITRNGSKPSLQCRDSPDRPSAQNAGGDDASNAARASFADA